MRKKSTFLRTGILGVLAIFLITGNINAAICTCSDCTTCTNALNDSGCDTVKLTADINNQTGTCINSPANFNNKTFDCQGHTIDGDNSGDSPGIYLNGKNRDTIRNCIITEFGNGIRLYPSSNNNTLTNNIANNNYWGIYLGSSSNNTLMNNTASSNKQDGIDLDNSSNNNLTNNTANSNVNNGIYLDDYSLNNNILNNEIRNNGGNGVYFSSSSTDNQLNSNILCSNNIDVNDEDSNQGGNNTCDTGTTACSYTCSGAPPNCSCSSCDECVKKLNTFDCSIVNLTADIINYSGTCINNPTNFNNKVFDCQGHTIDGDGGMYYSGIYLSSKENNAIKNCIITDFLVGISLWSSSNNNIVNNTANSMKFGGGIYLDSSSNNTLSNNTANSTGYGIYLDSSSNNTLSNNTANDNEDGIILYSSSNNNVSNNTANSNNDYGIYLNYDSLNNTLKGNKISYNNYGILSQNSNTIINSNIICNNIESDLYSSDWLSSSGDNNTCNVPDGWNDSSAAGCKYSCAAVVCECGSCMECKAKLNHPNCTVVNLTADIIDHSGTCIDGILDFNNKTFDCQGYIMGGASHYYGGSGYGIYLENKNNVTIKNCNVMGYTYGIYLYNSSNNSIINNTANQNEGETGGVGIYLTQSNNNLLKDNAANSNMVSLYSTGGGTPIGILLYQSSNNTLINNNANNNSYGGYAGDSGIGIYLDSSSSNTLSNNTANSNTNGIYLDYADSNNFTSNLVKFNKQHGFYALLTSTGNLLNQNTFCSNNQAGGAYYDIYDADTNSGDNNTCNTTYNYTDTDATSCTFPCSNQPPAADAGPDQTVMLGAVVTFNGSGSYDPDGNIVSYQWDFGDPYDSTPGTGEFPEYNYSHPDVYVVTLTVTDNNGTSSSDTMTVVVESKIILLELNYSKNGSIHLMDKYKKNGFAPDRRIQPKGERSYTAKVYSKSDKTSYAFTFDLPNFLQYDEPDGDNLTGGVIELNETDFTLIIPFFENAAWVYIYYPNSTLALEVDVKNLPDKGGSNCKTLINNGASAGLFDIVFVGDNYTTAQLAQFAADVNTHQSTLLSVAPFSNNSGNINIHWVNESRNLGCQYGTPPLQRLITCNSTAVMNLASQCPADEIIVILNSNTYGGSGMRGSGGLTTYAVSFSGIDPGQGANWSGDRVTVHEFGHSFGNLHDEYTYQTPYLGPADGPNCDYLLPCPKWQWWNLGCFPGCSNPGWYRGDNGGGDLMLTLINLNFGPVCTNALNGLLNQYPRSLCNSTIPCQCGDILTQSRTLNSSDFNKGACAGDGLEIGATGITLNCNGTSITGSGVSGSTGIKNILNNVTIKNCNVKDFNVGIHINDVSNNIINNNTVSSTTFSGGDGIWVETSTWNNVTDNTVSSHKWGIGLDTQSDNNVVEANTIYSCQWTDPSGNWIGYGITLYESSVNTIKNNNLTNNSYGIYFYANSNFNNISDNEILNNINAGITLSDCDPYFGCPGGNTNNTLQGNEISNNNYGIYSQNSNSTINSNTVCNNTLFDFNSPVWLSSSGDDNACGKPDGWNDAGTTGCTWTCPTGVATSTNAGTAYFYTSNGTITNLIAINESSLNQTGKPNMTFTYGFFEFNITGLSYGETITVMIELPGNLPANSEYWKYGPNCNNGGNTEWYEIPMGSNDGDNKITINLTDGGLGDDNCTQDGKIFDQGGPAGTLTIDSMLCDGAKKDAFNVSENVCTFGNARNYTCDIYRCNHTNNYTNFNLTVNCSKIATALTGTFNNTYVCTGGDENCSILTAHDLVLDCNQDGFYDKNTDAIDNQNVISGGMDGGFYVTPEPLTIFLFVFGLIMLGLLKTKYASTPLQGR